MRWTAGEASTSPARVLKNDFPAVTPVQMNYGGGLSDAFVTKISSPDIVTIAAVSAASFVGASLAPRTDCRRLRRKPGQRNGDRSNCPAAHFPAWRQHQRSKTEPARNARQGCFFASPSQINFQVPPGTVVGKATITITNAQAVSTSASILIEKTAPGLFAANANGQGVAAAVLVRVKPDSSQSFEPIAQINEQNRLVPLPLTSVRKPTNSSWFCSAQVGEAAARRTTSRHGLAA